MKKLLIALLMALFLTNVTSLNQVIAENIDTNNAVTTNQSQTQNENETQEIKTYEVHYVAIAAYYVDQFDVPEEVVELMPADHTAVTNEVVDPKQPSATSVGSWTFTGYEPGWAVVEDDDLWFYGVWENSEATEEDTSASGMRRNATITSGFGGWWSLSGGTYIGSHKFLLNGEEAYCIDHARKVPDAGTVYTSSGTTSSRVAGIIMMGIKNGRSHAAIQAAIWNYLHATNGSSYRFTAGGENVDYTSSDYNSSGYDCWIYTYEPSVSTAQTFATAGRYSVSTPPTGNIKVQKASSIPSLTSTEGYSLSGAIYGLYSDANCTNQVKTFSATDSNGTTKISGLAAGAKYYVKEITAPANYELDTTVYPVTVKSGQTVTINSTDMPSVGNIKLQKSSTVPIQSSLSNYSLAGAIYGLYSDVNCTNLVKTFPATDENGVTTLENLPKDTIYYIKEITAPTGYYINDKNIKIIVELNQTVTENVSDVPINDPINLIKRSYFPTEYEKYLDEVEYTFKYYDATEIDASSTPKYTWIFKASINSKGQAEVMLDKDHLVNGDTSLFASNGELQIPVGIVTIEESKAPQTFKRDENIYTLLISRDPNNPETLTETFLSGNYASLIDNTLVHIELSFITKTSAYFIHNNEQVKNVEADGYFVLEDIVEYDNLEVNSTYTLKAKAINKKTQEVIAEAQSNFTPIETSGSTTTTFNPIDLTGMDNQDIVVYEYLYLNNDLVTNHTDLEDENQTVHVDPLYHADVILEKENERNELIDGAFFNVSYKRIKASGENEENKLGTYVSGGIYVGNDSEFTLEFADNNEFTNSTTYQSQYDDVIGHYVVIYPEDGIYYTRVADQITTHKVTHGKVNVLQVAKNSAVTFTEIKAPDGYALDTTPVVINVGSDETITEVKDSKINPHIYEIKIQKYDFLTKKPEAVGFATLEGAVYEVYQLVDDEKVVVGTITTDVKGQGSISQTTNGDYLYSGMYYLKEITAPRGYVINDEIYEVNTDDINEIKNGKFTTTVDVRDGHTTITIKKVDSYGKNVIGATLQLYDGKELIGEYVTDEDAILIEGLEFDKSYTLHEVSTPNETYALAQDKTIRLDAQNVICIMTDHNIEIETYASFIESENKHFTADGVATITDEVSYIHLTPGRNYVIKGRVYDLGINRKNEEEIADRIIATQEVEFTPTEKNGSVSVEFEVNLDGYDNHRFVCLEQLYVVVDDELVFVAEDTDLNNEKQTVYVDPLYRVNVNFYKTSGKEKNVTSSDLLNGAVFSVKSSRTKADGTLVEKDLGTYISGGIYYEQDEEFELTLISKEANEEGEKFTKSYKSKLNKDTNKYYVRITDVSEGYYYATLDAETFNAKVKEFEEYIKQNYPDQLDLNNEEHAMLFLLLNQDYTDLDVVAKITEYAEDNRNFNLIYGMHRYIYNVLAWQYEAKKGAITLNNVEADTYITFTEIEPPNGFYIDSKPYTFDVGHDDLVENIDLYKSNNPIINTMVIYRQRITKENAKWSYNYKTGVGANFIISAAISSVSLALAIYIIINDKKKKSTKQ